MKISSHKRCLLVFFLLAVGVILLFTIAYFATKYRREKPAYVKKAEEILNKEKAELEDSEQKYNIEQTVMALYSMEKAIYKSATFEDITEFIVQQNAKLIAKDARELQHRFFNCYKELLDARDSLREMQSLYSIASGAISDLFSVSGGSVLSFGFSDEKTKEQARKIWQKRIESAKIEKKLKERLQVKSTELLNIIFDFADISAKYFREWDKLCASRDRTYLAFYERNFDEMIKSARTALAMFPDDEESAILLAVALIEKPQTETSDAEAQAILQNLLERTNGQSAPAYLLRGVRNFKNGEIDKAIIDFNQSTAYYPKQGARIENKLDLYKKRDFLHRSREGRVIVNSYRSIMTGAGYFSPDFQKARILLSAGEEDKARQKIFDHFFRRRLQGQWDKVLNDFLFCRDFLGTELNEILLTDKFNIKIEQSWLSSNPSVIVKNNDSRQLTNISILVCVRFTDMLQGDYISFPAGETLSVLPAEAKASFGKINLKEQSVVQLGTEKKLKDVIEYGAVLISDQIITWVAAEKVENIPTELDDKSSGDKFRKIIDNTIEKIIDSGK